MTHRRILSSPIGPEQAADHVGEWFRFPHVAPPNPGAGHLTLPGSSLSAAGVGANLACRMNHLGPAGWIVPGAVYTIPAPVAEVFVA